MDSSPQEWFKAFLPIYDGKTNNPTHPNTPYIGCTVGPILQTRKRSCLVLVHKVVSTQPSRHFPIWKSKDVNDDYNNDMGGCNIADQLCNYYHFDHWMRKHKWWWSFFFWAIGVLLVNTYVAYKTFMHQKGKVPMSHYQF